MYCLSLIYKLYVSFPVSLCDVEPDVDSDHDYETVDDTLTTMLKKAQENVMFY